jgi:hypothetical protein
MSHDEPTPSGGTRNGAGPETAAAVIEYRECDTFGLLPVHTHVRTTVTFATPRDPVAIQRVVDHLVTDPARDARVTETTIVFYSSTVTTARRFLALLAEALNLDMTTEVWENRWLVEEIAALQEEERDDDGVSDLADIIALILLARMLDQRRTYIVYDFPPFRQPQPGWPWY